MQGQECSARILGWGGSKQCYFLPSFLALIEVNADALELILIIARISSGRVNAVLGGHYLRESCKTTPLLASLPSQSFDKSGQNATEY
jgi:hypothetical protein